MTKLRSLEVPRFRIDLQDITLISRQIQASLRDLEEKTDQRLETITSDFRPYYAMLQSVHSTLQQMTPGSTDPKFEIQKVPAGTTGRQSMLSTLPEDYSDTIKLGMQQIAPSAMLYSINDGDMRQPDSRRSSSDTLVGEDVPEVLYNEKSMGGDLIQASVYRSFTCRKPCACRCHAPTTVKTPQWLSAAIGGLAILGCHF